MEITILIIGLLVGYAFNYLVMLLEDTSGIIYISGDETPEMYLELTEGLNDLKHRRTATLIIKNVKSQEKH